MKRFAVAYMATTMPKYDSADIKDDRIVCRLKDKIVFKGDVMYVAQAQAQSYLNVDIISAESGDQALHQVVDACSFVVKQATAVEIP